MRRREFITLLGGAAAAWPFTALSEQTPKLRTIGFLGAANLSAWRPWVAALVQRLHELGWIEGRTIAIEYRWAEGQEERYAAIAEEFVRLKVDVIVTSGAAVVAAKQATSAIPIVFGVANDPLSTGLVASLAHPGGNVTGLSLLAPELVGKRIELLREVIPNLRRVAFMGNVDYPASVLEMREAQITARTLGLEFAALEIKRVVDIVPAIEAMSSRSEACMSVLTRFSSPMHSGLTLWRLALACRPCTPCGSLSMQAGSCHMDQISQTSGAALVIMWTKFCAVRSRVIFQSNSQSNSNSWSIGSSRKLCGLKSLRPCSPAPTR